MVGWTFGHCRFVDPLGAGGMGDVYRAEDTRLGREVAIRVLPEAFINDPDRLSRLQQEAKVSPEPDVLAHEGLPGWISSHGLSVQTEKVVSAGNMYAHVARK